MNEGARDFSSPDPEKEEKREKRQRGTADNASFLPLLENSIRKISESMTPMNEKLK